MRNLSVVHQGCRHSLLILIRKKSFRTCDARIRELPAPALSRLHGEPRGPRVHLPLINIPPMLIRFASMKATRLNASDSVCRPQGYDVTGNVSGVLLVMPESTYRVLRCRGPVWIRSRANGWIAY